MDAIDNLIYSTLNVCAYPSLFVSNPVRSDFENIGINEPASNFPLPNGGQTTIPGNTFPSSFNSSTGIISYQQDTRMRFVTLEDSNVVADAMQKHWYDITNRISYTNAIGMIDATGTLFPMYNPLNSQLPSPPAVEAFVKFNIPPYHLIFSYLVENTRIAQIFERMLSMYVHDEKLTKANDEKAFRWIFNTETLFYSNSRSANRRSLNSQLRPVSEAIRRNAYQRMFGMDLAFGDQNNNTYPYTKADFANSSFITLFESFLVEFWRGFTNANNTSGQNTTDTEHLEDLARRLQELMMSRRTTDLDFINYKNFNLSAEEYSSYVFMYWLFYIVSFDSPVVSYLNCNANTPGERLINIGRKVGLPAHTKSIAILDIAQPMNLILRSMELGLFNNSNFLQRVMRSLSTINPIPNPTPQEIDILNNLLLIINNWEKATGHRIKNPEANITGTVRVQQNGLPQNGVAAKPKVIMN
jgi:hypothetical protein